MSEPATPDDFESQNEQSLSEVLNNPRNLPEGGLLGFGLQYQYPVKNYSDSVTEEGLESSLKGSDSAIVSLLSRQGLAPFLTAIYEDDHHHVVVMSDKLPASLSGEIDPDDDSTEFLEISSEALLSKTEAGAIKSLWKRR